MTPPRHTPARTAHRDDRGEPLFTNRLVDEASPYLRQHAHNPVQWWPFGDDAFAEARRRDVPVFLSVGYATCHWCHVMEEESFDDLDVAAVLNEHFVCVKVDREERPDVDNLYMNAVMALTGRGGWPMSVWLTPDTQKPFYAGTYFPKLDSPKQDGGRGAKVGFLTVLHRLAEAWQQERDQIRRSADAVFAELQAQLKPPTPQDAPGLVAMDHLVAAYAKRFDERWGGQTPAPKFPTPTTLLALLRHSASTGNRAGADMAVLTTRKIVQGGIFDQLGGGLHRYSTDARWCVPHFEKLLVDNALLVPLLLACFQHTGDPLFADAARATLGYLQREMTTSNGLFSTAQDADSLGPDGVRHEGAFFTWSIEELRTELQWPGLAQLGETPLTDAEFVAVVEAFGVRPAGNAGDEFPGRNVLWHPERFADVAKRHAGAGITALTASSLEQQVARARVILHRARAERPAPLRDDKVLTGHNALAISAFAQASWILDEPAYLDVAVAAWDALLAAHRQPDGHTGRNWQMWRTRRGAAGVPAFLDDHAFLAAAALDLFEATGLCRGASEARFLDAAIGIDAVVAEHFEDRAEGGFFLTPPAPAGVATKNGVAHLHREKPDRDGVEPSGNSVHLETLMRLTQLTDDVAFRDRADRGLRAFGSILERSPLQLSAMWQSLALDEAGLELAVVWPEGVPSAAALDEAGQQLWSVLRRRLIPHRVVVVAVEGSALWRRLPLLKDRPAAAGRLTVYVCEGGACRLPVTTSRDLMAALSSPGAG